MTSGDDVGRADPEALRGRKGFCFLKSKGRSSEPGWEEKWGLFHLSRSLGINCHKSPGIWRKSPGLVETEGTFFKDFCIYSLCTNPVIVHFMRLGSLADRVVLKHRGQHHPIICLLSSYLNTVFFCQILLNDHLRFEHIFVFIAFTTKCLECHLKLKKDSVSSFFKTK